MMLPVQFPPQVKWKELLKLNAPDWHLVTLGIIASATVGCLFPLMSLLFSEMLDVCGDQLLFSFPFPFFLGLFSSYYYCSSLKVFSSNNRQEIEDRVRVLALGFVALAIGAGLANFSSVSL